MTEIKINKKMVYLSDHLADLAAKHRGRTMKKQLEVKIVWHPYPEEPLPETEFDRTYLVTAVGADVKPHVRTEFGSREHGFEIYPKDVEVIAWAELPDAYAPPELHDMHPDAETARKYTKRDSETLKRLGIFDE